MDIDKILTKILTKGFALSFGDFVLSSGIKSSYYINFSYLTDRPDYLNVIINALVELIKKKIGLTKFDRLVGVSNKGALLLSPLSIKLDKPFAYLDKYSMEILLGNIKVDDTLLFVDDIINTGFTAERLFLHVKNKFNANIRYIAVILDREEGGTSKIKRKGVKVYTLAKMSRLTKILRDYGAISEEEYNIIIENIGKRRGSYALKQ